MEPLNILIFNWRDIRNPDAGGAEVVTHEVARRRASAGRNVTIFTSKFQGCKEHEVIDGVTIIGNAWGWRVRIGCSKGQLCRDTSCSPRRTRTQRSGCKMTRG